MHRKEFLKTLIKAGFGIGCCGAAIGQSLPGYKNQSPDTGQSWIRKMEERMTESSKHPAWRRVEKAQMWIKDIVSNMDSILDEETRVKLLQANGRSCCNNAYGVASEEKLPPEAGEQYLKRLENAGYEVQRKGDITVIYYNWGKDHQNPFGLILGDGNCLCPVVETIKSGLSPSYCQCSAGYVGELFRRQIGRPIKAEVINSLKMGGDDCIFRLEISNS